MKITLEEAEVDVANGRWLFFRVARARATNPTGSQVVTKADVTADGERCDIHALAEQTDRGFNTPT